MNGKEREREREIKKKGWKRGQVSLLSVWINSRMNWITWNFIIFSQEILSRKISLKIKSLLFMNDNGTPWGGLSASRRNIFLISLDRMEEKSKREKEEEEEEENEYIFVRWEYGGHYKNLQPCVFPFVSQFRFVFSNTVHLPCPFPANKIQINYLEAGWKDVCARR